MGARVAQELTLARPDLVRKAVFLAGHARMDHFQQVLTEGERQLFDSGVALPAKYRAAVTAVMNLSPATLADDHSARDWMDIFEFTAAQRHRVFAHSSVWTAPSIDGVRTSRSCARACPSLSPTTA